jgi:hypothetical protein
MRGQGRGRGRVRGMGLVSLRDVFVVVGDGLARLVDRRVFDIGF